MIVIARRTIVNNFDFTDSDVFQIWLTRFCDEVSQKYFTIQQIFVKSKMMIMHVENITLKSLSYDRYLQNENLSVPVLVLLCQSIEYGYLIWYSGIVWGFVHKKIMNNFSPLVTTGRIHTSSGSISHLSYQYQSILLMIIEIRKYHIPIRNTWFCKKEKYCKLDCATWQCKKHESFFFFRFDTDSKSTIYLWINGQFGQISIS